MAINILSKIKSYYNRIDGDGQMDLKLIKNFMDPIIENKGEFLKGNSFKFKYFERNAFFKDYW